VAEDLAKVVPCEKCRKLVPVGEEINIGKLIAGEIELPRHEGHLLNVYTIFTLNILRGFGQYYDYPVEEVESDK